MTEVVPAPSPTAAALRDRPDGTVVTFYSYKGGVGRSMALANTAWLLASKYGRRVIVVDLDIEAPGLHWFFGIEDNEVAPGLIDYLTSYKDAMSQPDPKFSMSDVLIDPYLQRVNSFSSRGSLHLMSAGSQQDRASYFQKVRGFDWKGFYDNWGGAQLIEAMRTQLRQAADVTLIDSRTGLTDIGGVCTVQLPDIVVFAFVFNWQNMIGVETVASELHDTENKTLKALKRWPTLHFLTSRKEFTEQQRLRDWEARAERMFASFCDSPPVKGKYGERVIDYLRDLSIPYIPFFAYGEELAAKTDLGLEISKALQPLIELLLREGPLRVLFFLWLAAGQAAAPGATRPLRAGEANPERKQAARIRLAAQNRALARRGAARKCAWGRGADRGRVRPRLSRPRDDVAKISDQQRLHDGVRQVRRRQGRKLAGQGGDCCRRQLQT